jgi:hypothetical protein
MRKKASIQPAAVEFIYRNRKWFYGVGIGLIIAGGLLVVLSVPFANAVWGKSAWGEDASEAWNIRAGAWGGIGGGVLLAATVFIVGRVYLHWPTPPEPPPNADPGAHEQR